MLDFFKVCVVSVGGLDLLRAQLSQRVNALPSMYPNVPTYQNGVATFMKFKSHLVEVET